MNKKQAYSKYSKIYREAGTGGEETNDQIAYKTILIALRNLPSMSDVRAEIEYHASNTPNQDRKEIYICFLEETSK